jgi:hypothetical protein
MSAITSEERLNLKRLINETECEDNTSNIRKLKHSVLIRDDIRRLDTLKIENATIRSVDPEGFLVMARAQASFLYNNYTDLFNKIQSIDEENYQIARFTSEEVFALKSLLGIDSEVSAKLVLGVSR